MPQQLVYTSWPRSLTPGRSGFCTVGMSAGLKEALKTHLEGLSYYVHLPPAQIQRGAKNHLVCAYRLVNLRGTEYHILSRIQDAGPDFTNRSNFLAHHLVFTPEEIMSLPSPPVLFRKWPGWLRVWSGEPRHLPDEPCSSFAALARAAEDSPAKTWKRLTGEGGHALSLLELDGPALLRADRLAEDDLLSLFGESLAMFRIIADQPVACPIEAWRFTFTTLLQDQDNPNDFHWRCVYADSPAAAKVLAGRQMLRDFGGLRAKDTNAEFRAYANEGLKPLELAVQPEIHNVKEGATVEFHAEARGIPPPVHYQWCLCLFDGGEDLLKEGATEKVYRLSNVTAGERVLRVKVRNRWNQQASKEATLNVQAPVRLSTPAEEPEWDAVASTSGSPKASSKRKAPLVLTLLTALLALLVAVLVALVVLKWKALFGPESRVPACPNTLVGQLPWQPGQEPPSRARPGV